MPITIGFLLSIFTLLFTLLILAVSAWNLYLSHYHEPRSEVEVQSEDYDTLPKFDRGPHAIDESASWDGNLYLKVVNTGDKSAYVREFSHSLTGLVKDDDVLPPEGAYIEIRGSTSSSDGNELEPHSSQRSRVSLRICPEEDIGVLVEHDSALIEHVLKVEDNKGAYEVTHTSEILLTGPEGAIENWEEHLERESE